MNLYYHESIVNGKTVWRVWYDGDLLGEYKNMYEAVYRKNIMGRAIELVKGFTELRSLKLSDYSRIEWPTAKLCAVRVADEVLSNSSLSYSDRKKWEQIRIDINKL